MAAGLSVVITSGHFWHMTFTAQAYKVTTRKMMGGKDVPFSFTHGGQTGREKNKGSPKLAEPEGR